MKISVIVYTARDDRPYLEREDLHCFDPVTQTLAAQEFRDFELIVVDALWDQRGDWFAEHPQPFPVKHVPPRANQWHAMGRPAVACQCNTGLAHAEGDLCWIGAENNLYPPHLLGLVWNLYEQQGIIPVAYYGFVRVGAHPREAKPMPVAVPDMLGYPGASALYADHRADRWLEPDAPEMSLCHHQNTFAYMALPTELALEINGYDEAFDGDLDTMDVDLGSRIQMAGHWDALKMHRRVYVVEPMTWSSWRSRIVRGPVIKCGYGMWLWARKFQRVRANLPRPADWVEQTKQICERECSLGDDCRRDRQGVKHSEGRLYPFCTHDNLELRDQWLRGFPFFDLAEHRRLAAAHAPPFDRGYFHPGGRP